MLEYILNLDHHLFVLINSQWTAEWANAFFPFITDMHKIPWIKFTMLPLIIALMIWRRGVKKGIIIFLMTIIAVSAADGVGNWGFKKTIQRPRPANTEGLHVEVRAPFGGYSFVSNHSNNMFSFATFTAVMFPPAAVPMFTLATLVAYSRVYNGVHFPTDVICGALLGALIGYLFALLTKKILERVDGNAEGVLSNESPSHGS